MATLNFLWALVFLLVHVTAPVFAVTVTVNLTQQFQTMDGFGFSQAFGQARNVKNNWSAAAQKQTLDWLFSPTAGAGMNILRNRIGSGASAPGDSILPNNPGGPNATPQYVWDGDDRGQVWFSKQAMTYGVKTFYANAWSAPGFMKTNNNEANGGYLCGVTGKTCSSGDWKQAYANMLVQYMRYYQQEGITVTHLGFLNEPDYTTDYSSMLSDGRMAASFIRVLRPTLNNAGFSNIKIICCDSLGWGSTTGTYIPQLQSENVINDVAIISSHGYAGNPSSTGSTTKPVWQSENAALSTPFNPNNWYSNGAVPEGLTWALRIYESVIRANASGYLYWYGANSCDTNSALICMLPGATMPTASKRLWAFAHWGRYVRPGAVRLGVSGSASGVSLSAFRNTDGTISVQAINNSGSAQSIELVMNGGGGVGSAQAWVTRQGVDMGTQAVSVSGGRAAGESPARSMVTFVLRIA